MKKKGLKLNIPKTKIMASSPITSWQIDGETMETVKDFIFLGSKLFTFLAPQLFLAVDGDCSHEIKRDLFLGRKAMTNLEPASPVSPALADGFSTTGATWEAHCVNISHVFCVHSRVDRNVGYFQKLAAVNSTAVTGAGRYCLEILTSILFGINPKWRCWVLW